MDRKRERERDFVNLMHDSTASHFPYDGLVTLYAIAHNQSSYLNIFEVL
jgi:hypothetical protein